MGREICVFSDFLYFCGELYFLAALPTLLRRCLARSAVIGTHSLDEVLVTSPMHHSTHWS